MKKVELYWFSGTGNTLLAAQCLADSLRAGGVQVDFRSIERHAPEKVSTLCTLGLCFPVACFSTYPVVTGFISRLPFGNGAGVFILDTMGGSSLGYPSVLYRILKAKGYLPLGACEIVMPSNFLPAKIDSSEAEKLKKGLEKAGAFGKALLENKAEWKRIPCLPHIASLLFKPAWKTMAKRGTRYQINRNLCSKCGLCEKLCPAGNITMETYPCFGKNCQQCMRCVMFCPLRAISYGSKRFIQYKKVDSADLLLN
jgi:ferredoxin